ncbi:EIN3-binding F-box protein 1-like [Rhododendron vialii]|uniref:EIN3-binding F-box protein 1-like n=1 Tax=Rhododendron vialii TaxID=182163 RepID=UPI00265DC183|nr:EIN3-binding F-box protein 1-like [Rhododendron vialii]
MDGILCDEVLEEVFRRLPFPSSAAEVSLVSKRWLRLCRSSMSDVSLCLSVDNCTAPSLSSFLSYFPHLSFLKITTVTLRSDGGDISGFRYRILSPDDISAFADQILLSVASSCPKLTGLRLQSGPVSLFPLLSLSTSCPHLTSLDITLSRPFSFHWLVFLHSLRKLALSFCPIPGKFKHVDAASKGSFDDAELKLETLSLSHIPHGDYGFDWLWKSCKNLKKLQLCDCQGIGNGMSLSSFVNCLKGLQEVELTTCRPIVDEILTILAENCASLSSLLVYNGGGREGLRHFITQSRLNLRKLDLCLPHDLRDNHLLAVAEKFRGLSSLRLDSCYRVTGEGLKAMVLAMSDKLEELALINCNMKPGLLTTLGHSFTNLKILDLSYNDMLAEEEFILMLALFNCLRELKVRGCRGLTIVSVVSMFKRCKQLESVDIMNCPQIEAKAVELFVLNCLQLRQIHVEESKLSDVSRSWASKKFIEVIFDE